jgi:hypothetical protein
LVDYNPKIERKIKMIDWKKIQDAVELIKTNEMVNRIDIIKGKIVVYAVPSPANPKNVIRIDIKE